MPITATVDWCVPGRALQSEGGSTSVPPGTGTPQHRSPVFRPLRCVFVTRVMRWAGQPERQRSASMKQDVAGAPDPAREIACSQGLQQCSGSPQDAARRRCRLHRVSVPDDATPRRRRPWQPPYPAIVFRGPVGYTMADCTHDPGHFSRSVLAFCKSPPMICN
jgi:hypothetical protein